MFSDQERVFALRVASFLLDFASFSRMFERQADLLVYILQARRSRVPYTEKHHSRQARAFQHT